MASERINRPGWSGTTPRWLVVAIVVGVGARFLSTARGYNVDVESWMIVGEIVDHAGSIYNETYRYPYAPVWAAILGVLYKLTFGLGLGIVAFHFAIAAVLSAVDVVMALVVNRRFGATAAALFILNPVSILITGYHSQFDNFAILVALFGAILLSDREHERGLTRRELGGLLLLGLSLAVKHILVLMPLWVAFRKPDIRSRLIALALPPLVFALAFLPFVPSSREGIVNHVLKYRSYNNTPLLRLLLLGKPVPFAVATLILVGALLAAGLYLRRRLPLDESLLVYVLITVAVAPAIANQYLAICAVAVAVFWNPVFALYTAYATVFLLGDYDGLHFSFVPDVFERDSRFPPYQYIALMLLVATVWHGWKQHRTGPPPSRQTTPERTSWASGTSGGD